MLKKPPNHHIFDPEPAWVSPMLQCQLDTQNTKATVPTSSSSALKGTIDIIHALMVQHPASDAPAQVIGHLLPLFSLPLQHLSILSSILVLISPLLSFVTTITFSLPFSRSLMKMAMTMCVIFILSCSIT